MDSFSNALNYYIENLNCTARDLSLSSGISVASISRYRSGSRIPQSDSPIIKELARGIQEIALNTNGIDRSEFDIDSIYNRLSSPLPSGASVYPDFSHKFSRLLEAGSISLKDLADFLECDSSYLSRIRSGSRRPGDYGSFIEMLAVYIAKNLTSKASIAAISSLLECDMVMLDANSLPRVLDDYFTAQKLISNSGIDKFLQMFNDTDFNDYQKTLNYQEFRDASTPFTSKTESKSYNGISGMSQAELDFLRTAAGYKQNTTLSMYSSISGSIIDADNVFMQKKILGLFACIRKGININVIKSMNKSTPKLISDLILWLPLYMSGKVNALYLSSLNTGDFMNLSFVTQSNTLYGECIRDYQNDGICILSADKKNIEYQNNKMSILTKKSSSLLRAFPAGSSYTDADSIIRTIEPTDYPNISIDICRAPHGNFAVIKNTHFNSMSLALYHPKLVEIISSL